MIGNEAQHARDLAARREVLFRAEPPHIDVSVLDAAVERPEVDDDELPGTAREALEVCLAAERRAGDFYARALRHISDPGVRAFFKGLMQEEADHAALLARAIAEQPEATTPGHRGALPAVDPGDPPSPHSIVEPRTQIGVRFAPNEKFDIDLIWGRNITGENAHWVTLGLNVHFDAGR